MKRSVHTGRWVGLLSCVMWLSMPSPSEASDERPAERLDEVAVTGSRAPLELGQSARIVTVLDSLAIASLPVLTINDVLKYAVGVDVRQRGVEGMQTDVSIRGGTFDQIAVLINGVNVSDPQTGHNGADFPVDVSQIERIEVLEGPASRVYGASSLVGAINVITKRLEAPASSPEESRQPLSWEAGARLDGGSYLTFGAGTFGALAHGGWSHTLSAGYVRSNGYTRNASGGLNGDFQSVKAFYRGTYKSLFWQAGLSNKDYGANTFYSSRYDDQFEHTLKTTLAVGAQTQGFVRFKPLVYWNFSHDRFELFRGRADRYPYNYHKTNVAGARLCADLETVAGRTSFGAEARNEHIRSTNLGEPLERPEGVYARGLNRTQLSAWLEHNLTLSWFTFSAGLTAAYNTGSKEKVGFYPGVDLSFRIAGNWKLYLSYNASYRPPTFTELYYSVGGHQADKLLRSEKMHAVEAGVKYLLPGLRAIVSVWYHHGIDMIDWVRASPEADWLSVNHTRINALGQEVTLRADFPQLLGWSFWQNVQVAYSHIDQDKQLQPGEESLYALEYLRHKLVVQTDFKLWSALFLNLSVRWQERVGPYQPCVLLDAQLSWNAPQWRVFLQADNLLDRPWYDHGNIPQPGLWIRLGASCRFGSGK